jgi:hypothetical protein
MAERKPSERIHRVIFHNQGQVYEVYARTVAQGGLLGFVTVEDLLFGEKTQIVVDPGEEKLRTEFDGVRRFLIPIHAVIRIDEVEKRGVARATAAKDGGNVALFPSPVFGKPGGEA